MKVTATNAFPPELEPLSFDIAKLQPDPNNARLHNERNMDLVKRSLERHGWRGVVVARKRDRRILAGHARVQAAKELGWTKAPVLFVPDDDGRATAFAIADNRSSELGAWDNAFLKEAMLELDEADRADLGFSLEEFEQLVAPTLPKGWDDEPEPAEPARAKKAPTAAAAQQERRSVLLLFTKAEHKRWKAAMDKRLAKAKRKDVATVLIEAVEALKR